MRKANPLCLPSSYEYAHRTPWKRDGGQPPSAATGIGCGTARIRHAAQPPGRRREGSGEQRHLALVRPWRPPPRACRTYMQPAWQCCTQVGTLPAVLPRFAQRSQRSVGTGTNSYCQWRSVHLVGTYLGQLDAEPVGSQTVLLLAGYLAGMATRAVTRNRRQGTCVHSHSLLDLADAAQLRLVRRAEPRLCPGRMGTSWLMLDSRSRRTACRPRARARGTTRHGRPTPCLCECAR